MAGTTSNRKGPIATINVTPLVDVVLVLLIIFMVTADMLKEDEHAIPIELPSAAASDQKKKEPFTVVVTQKGQYIKDGAPVTEAAVVAAAKALVAQKGPDAEAVVAADKNATHEKFVKLLDILRQVGISRFAIQTDVPK